MVPQYFSHIIFHGWNSNLFHTTPFTLSIYLSTISHHPYIRFHRGTHRNKTVLYWYHAYSCSHSHNTWNVMVCILLTCSRLISEVGNWSLLTFFCFHADGTFYELSHYAETGKLQTISNATTYPWCSTVWPKFVAHGWQVTIIPFKWDWFTRAYIQVSYIGKQLR